MTSRVAALRCKTRPWGMPECRLAAQARSKIPDHADRRARPPQHARSRGAPLLDPQDPSCRTPRRGFASLRGFLHEGPRLQGLGGVRRGPDARGDGVHALQRRPPRHRAGGRDAGTGRQERAASPRFRGGHARRSVPREEAPARAQGADRFRGPPPRRGSDRGRVPRSGRAPPGDLLGTRPRRAGRPRAAEGRMARGALARRGGRQSGEGPEAGLARAFAHGENMNAIAVRNIHRADGGTIASLERLGVATVHEAQGRTGLMLSYMRPLWRGARVAGSAVTALVHPGDNWMIHVAVETIKPGDVLVVACSSPNEDGHLGELLAAACKARGPEAGVVAGGARRARGWPRRAQAGRGEGPEVRGRTARLTWRESRSSASARSGRRSRRGCSPGSAWRSAPSTCCSTPASSRTGRQSSASGARATPPPPGAREWLARAQSLGMNVEIVSEEVGPAAAIKMFRSIMVKGFEGLMLECMLAGSEYGVEDRIVAALKESYPGVDWQYFSGYWIERVLTHGKRRAA